MLIEINDTAVERAGESAGLPREQLDQHLSEVRGNPITLAMIASTILRVPLSLQETCTVTSTRTG